MYSIGSTVRKIYDHSTSVCKLQEKDSSNLNSADLQNVQ